MVRLGRYYPAGERGFVSTYQRAIVVSAGGAIGAAISEFWPGIAHGYESIMTNTRPLPTTGTVNPQKAEADDTSQPEHSNRYPSSDLLFSRLGGAVL